LLAKVRKERQLIKGVVHRDIEVHKSDQIIIGNCVSGLHSPHEGLTGGSGQSMSGLAYYQPEHPGSTGVVKYPENGHDTLSDFVTFVCQEAENTQQLPQVII